MKPAFALLALLIASPALADGISNNEVYLRLCQPSNDQHLNEKALNEVKELRPAFQAFLANPKPSIETFRKSALLDKSADPEGLTEITVSFVLTCGLTEIVHKEIEASGCYDSTGTNFSAKEALSLCLPLIKQIREQQNSDSQN
jgi:hypothetical protein